jgi:hypothetical protein
VGGNPKLSAMTGATGHNGLISGSGTPNSAELLSTELCTYIEGPPVPRTVNSVSLSLHLSMNWYDPAHCCSLKFNRL